MNEGNTCDATFESQCRVSMWLSLVVIVGLVMLVVGCGAQDENSRTEGEAVDFGRSVAESRGTGAQHEPTVVDLRNPHSIRRFLEAALGLEMKESANGYSGKSEDVKADIWAQRPDSDVVEAQIVFSTMNADTVERCVALTRRLLVAAGEDVREVEEKVDRGRAAFRPGGEDGVELRFHHGAYVRFSIWVRGDTQMAAVVVSPR